MSNLWLHNLIAYGLQIAILAVAGALLLRLLRIRMPKVRLLCWQALLTVCILLPVIQPRLPLGKLDSAVQITTGPATTALPSRQSRPISIPVAPLVVVLLGAGVLFRLAMLGIGFRRLRVYRRNSTFVPGAFEALQKRIRVFADFRVSPDVTGPVTFGVLHPVILLPQGCLEDESIACHELVHVRRRDWLFTVIEEVVLSLFWFHPAMWWLVAEIQLAREEAVDRAVVEVMNSREQYLEALLALAAAKAGMDLAPASPFLRKRHLHKRVASLMQEISMSRFHLNSSLALFIAILTAAGWLGMRSFPLQAAPQDQIDPPGVAVQSSGLTLLHRTAVMYPQEALTKRIQGSVVVELTLADSGTVSDARIISGPEELRKSTLQSVLQWHYAKDAPGQVKTQVTVDFRLPENRPGTTLNVTPTILPPDRPTTLQRIIIRAPEALKQRIESSITVREGDQISRDAMQNLRASLANIDEHLGVAVAPGDDTSGSVLVITLGGAATPLAPGKIRVGGNVQQVKLTHKVTPVYPPLAKQARIQGTVRFTATIAKDGTVKELEVMMGHPLLVEAARAAVSAWQYEPTLLNGDPVEVVTVIDVNFTLSDGVPPPPPPPPAGEVKQ